MVEILEVQKPSFNDNLKIQIVFVELIVMYINL